MNAARAFEKDGRPTLYTGRLILRPSRPEDAERISVLLSDRLIPDTAMYIPHPCSVSVVREWIANHPKKFATGASVDFYVCEKSEELPIGAVHLDIEPEHDRAELGYWIGAPYWNRGFATEAASAVLSYAFEVRQLRRVYGYYLCRNAASRRVVEKVGLLLEGIVREHVKKWDKYEDIQYFGIGRAEYLARGTKSAVAV